MNQGLEATAEQLFERHVTKQRALQKYSEACQMDRYKQTFISTARATGRHLLFVVADHREKTAIERFVTHPDYSGDNYGMVDTIDQAREALGWLKAPESVA